MSTHASWMVGFITGIWLTCIAIAIVTQQGAFVGISIFGGILAIVANIILLECE